MARKAAYAFAGRRRTTGYKRRRRKSLGHLGRQFASIGLLVVAFGGMYLYDHFGHSLPASFGLTTRSQEDWTQPVDLPFCGSGSRVNCIVDGDTIWLRGEKIRLEGFNAPEINGNCTTERDLAQRAKRRLRELLSGQTLSIARNGHDVYGRTLATIRTSSGDAADIMVSQGLAHVWRGYKESWCG